MDLCYASVSFAKDGNLVSAKSALEEAKDLANDVDDAEVQILQTLLHLHSAEGDINNYLYFMERLVDINLDDNNKRFSLAYNYDQAKQNELALYHYRVLTKRQPTETNWNNRGVAEANLNLPSKSVHSYLESVKLGGTLAMSNLAHKFITAGFLTEAENLYQEAIKIPNCDEQIGSVITKIIEAQNG